MPHQHSTTVDGRHHWSVWLQQMWHQIKSVAEAFWDWLPLRRTGYAIGNLVRWGLTFAMLIFLLALIVSLYEAVNFQNRVSALAAGQEGARRVLLELYELKEEGRLQADGGTLPLGAMAVKLDHVRAARAKLGQFTFQSRAGTSGGGATQAASQSAKSGGKGSAPDRPTASADASSEVDPQIEFEAALQTLTASLGELQYELQNQNGGIKIALGLARLEAAADRLGSFEFVPRANGQGSSTDSMAKEDGLGQAADGAADSADGAADPSTLEYKQTVDEFDGLIDDIKAGVLLEPQAPFIAAQLNQLATYAAQLKGYYKSDSFKSAPAEAVDGARASQPTSSNPVAAMKREVDAMQTALREHESEFWIADQIAQSINAMSAQVEDLKSQEVIGFEPADTAGETFTPAQIRGEFDGTLEGLSAAIRELEETLSKRTPVATIASALRVDGNVPADLAASRAQTILLDFRSLDRFRSVLLPFGGSTSWFSWIGGLGINPQSVATLSSDSLRLVFIFVVGAIGSVLYIAKRQMQLALQGHWMTQAPKRPLMWLVFRPFFGVVVALAVFLVVRAGQMALGGEGSEIGSGANLNLPILAVIALFAGLLSWHAVDAIESKGKVWFQGQSRRDLWATGLDHTLKDAGRSVDECANQIGRSVEQVERWLMFRDKVTPEMQDRIATWLERSIDEMFGDITDESLNSSQPMWASGLRSALDDGSRKLDPTALAELIGEGDADRVKKWIEMETQVSPAMQWRLVDALSVPHRLLFDANQQKRNAWAAGLRAALEQRGGSVKGLADALPIEPQRVRDWMELKEAVPPNRQSQIAAELRQRHGRLFDYTRPPLAYASHLRPFMETQRIDAAKLAEDLDVDAERVAGWLDLDQPVAPATQRRIAAIVGIKAEDAFTTEPHGPPTRWAVDLGEALDDVDLEQVDLAKAIEVSPIHVAKWVAREQPVPAPAERRIVKELRRRGLRRAAYQGFDDRQIADELFGRRWAAHVEPQLTAQGKTAADLARAIGSDPAHVARWLACEHPVPKAVESRIADALGVDAADLFSDHKP